MCKTYGAIAEAGFRLYDQYAVEGIFVPITQGDRDDDLQLEDDERERIKASIVQDESEMKLKLDLEKQLKALEEQKKRDDEKRAPLAEPEDSAVEDESDIEEDRLVPPTDLHTLRQWHQFLDFVAFKYLVRSYWKCKGDLNATREALEDDYEAAVGAFKTYDSCKSDMPPYVATETPVHVATLKRERPSASSNEGQLKRRARAGQGDPDGGGPPSSSSSGDDQGPSPAHSPAPSPAHSPVPDETIDPDYIDDLTNIVLGSNAK